MKESLPSAHSINRAAGTRSLPAGLNEEVVHLISTIRQEDKRFRDFRIEAYRTLQEIQVPTWSSLSLPTINLNNFSYFAGHAYDEPAILEELSQLAQSLNLDISPESTTEFVLDSLSVFNRNNSVLAEHGIIFCSMTEAIKRYPDLVHQYLGSVVPVHDNYFAALNSAVFSDGSFIFIPPHIHCPLNLTAHFRIYTPKVGQFERTLIIASEHSKVTYLEGCTAPSYSSEQLHAAVVEIIAHDYAQVNYSTIQNWYPGDKSGQGGVYNFVTKRGLAHTNAKISWVQIEAGAAITWKYPSVVLQGDNSCGEFHSLALTANHQQADTGSKMIHLGKNTASVINAKSMVSGQGSNAYRGKVFISNKSLNSHNFTRCDALLLSNKSQSHTFPTNHVANNSSSCNHEAATHRISSNQLFYMATRGLSERDSERLIMLGFSTQIMEQLPLEFALEARQLINLVFQDGQC